MIGVKKTAKIVQTVYNQLSEKYDSMTAGMIQATIVDTIAGLSGGGDPKSGSNTAAMIPAGASITGGEISFYNEFGCVLFSVSLPVYAGGVS